MTKSKMSKLSNKEAYEIVDLVFQSERRGKRLVRSINFVNFKTACRFLTKWVLAILFISLSVWLYFASRTNQYHLKYLHKDSRLLLTAIILFIVILGPFIILMHYIMMRKQVQDSTTLYANAFRYLKRNLKCATSLKLIKLYDLSLYKKLFFAYFVGRGRECVKLIKNNQDLNKLNARRNLNLKVDSKVMHHDRVLSKQLTRKFKIELHKVEQNVDEIIAQGVNAVYLKLISNSKSLHKLPDDLYEKAVRNAKR